MSFKKSVATTFGLNAFTFLAGFFNSVMAARLLGPEGRGVFTLYSTAVELLAMLLGFGLPHALLFYAAKDQFDRPRLFSFSFAALGASTFVFVVLLVASRWLGFQHLLLPPPYNDSFSQLIMVVYFAGLSGWYLFVSILNGHRLFPQTNLISLVSIGGTLVIYAALFFSTSAGVKPPIFYVIQMAMSLVTLACCFWVHHRSIASTYSFSFPPASGIASMVRYGVLIFVSNVMFFLTMKLDYWFVNYFSGAADLGQYSLASNVGLTMMLLPNSVGLVLTAFKANDKSDLVDNWSALLCRVTFFISLVLAAFLFLAGDYLILFLYGEAFLDSYLLLKMLLLGIVPYSVFTVLRNYFAGAGLLRELLVVSILSLFITVGLDVLLIPSLGTRGAAIASVSTYIVSTLVLAWRFQLKTGTRWHHLFVFTLSDFRLIRASVTSFLPFKK
ncbi:MAG: oligosaccharide flippase family protein [Cyclobacteriaceae bacterium]|jgi:O-antigen/teichoic acid export membrane protein